MVRVQQLKRTGKRARTSDQAHTTFRRQSTYLGQWGVLCTAQRAGGHGDARIGHTHHGWGQCAGPAQHRLGVRATEGSSHGRGSKGANRQ